MESQSLYTPEIWQRFCDKIAGSEKDFELKTYPHFDPLFNFYKEKEKIRKLVADPTLQSVAQHSFLPFLKIITSTPRYRWQENEKEYMLETKNRPIAFASHFDTYLYAFYSFVLTEKYQRYIIENKFHECVLAYRTDLNGKCNIQFAKEVFDTIKNKSSITGCCDVIALDITGYFDNINHTILREKWRKILNVDRLPADQYKLYKSLTRYSYVHYKSVLRHFVINLRKLKSERKNTLNICSLINDDIAGTSFKEKFDLLRRRRLLVKNRSANKGIPQGSAMSALLSNVYLIDFDKWLYDLSVSNDFVYRRYCDDLIIICNPADTDSINNLLVSEIEKKYGLEIQPKKTEFISFRKTSRGKVRGVDRKQLIIDKITLSASNEEKYYKNLQYLGFEFNGENVYIRHSSLSRFFRKMKGRIIKTTMMSYSNKSKTDRIKRAQIYLRYSHFGPRNFYTYAQKAAKAQYKNREGVLQPGMDSISIKRQLSAHVRIIEKEIRSKSVQRFEYKKYVRSVKHRAGKKQKVIPFKL